MRQAARLGKFHRVLLGAARWGGIGSLLTGLAVYVCYRADRTVLREIATGIVEGVSSPAERVLAVNAWVHWQNGFVANKQSFLVSRFRATPLQVVDEGGDCADKSRLVVALLAEVDIPATPAMCFDRVTGEPVHTVVEARLGDEDFIVVDPSFDLFFPKMEPGKYYGLLEMRRDPTILTSRLREITSSRSYWMRVNGYRQERSVYDLASTFNWNRNLLTRVVRASLVPSMGESVHRIQRPRVLEEPKLAVACAAGLLGVGMLTCSAVVARRARRKDHHAAELVASASSPVAQPLLRDRSITREHRHRKVLESV